MADDKVVEGVGLVCTALAVALWIGWVAAVVDVGLTWVGDCDGEGSDSGGVLCARAKVKLPKTSTTETNA